MPERAGRSPFSGSPLASEGTHFGSPQPGYNLVYQRCFNVFSLSLLPLTSATFESFKLSVTCSVLLYAVTKKTTSCDSSFAYHHIAAKPYPAHGAVQCGPC